MIGPDAVYKNNEMDSLMTIGKGRDDLIYQSFFFDPKEQTLYLNIGGEPGWFVVELGVRGFALTASKVHNVVIRGLEIRHNRQPGGQWSMVSIGECQRVVMEDCQRQAGGCQPDRVAETLTRTRLRAATWPRCHSYPSRPNRMTRQRSSENPRTPRENCRLPDCVVG